VDRERVRSVLVYYRELRLPYYVSAIKRHTIILKKSTIKGIIGLSEKIRI
jgi:hypothetical protein